MTENTTYEVHVQQGGRWSIHATFLGHQGNDAINEGKELDRLTTIDAVKVIKEVYDAQKDRHNEFIIFKSSTMKSAAGKGGDFTGGGSFQKETWIRYDEDDNQDRAKPRSRRRPVGKKKTSTLTMVMVKLLMVVLFSIGLASALSALIDELLGGTRLFGVHFVGNAQSNLLIGVFIVTFLLSALSMTVTVMRGETLEDSRRRRPLKQQTKLAKQAKIAKQKAQKKVARAQAMAPAKKNLAAGPGAAAGPSAQILNESSLSPSTETLAGLDQAVKGGERPGISQQASETKEAVGQDLNERLKTEISQGKPDPASGQTGRGVVLDAETHGKAPQVETMTPAEEKQKTFMLGFLGKGLEGSQTDQKKMDNFNKFGINLYIAGACEILSQKRNLDVRASSKILADAVQGIGFKKSHAASFADRYEEYLMADSRYMQMFQAGRNAMNICLTDESAAPKLLDSALEDWNKPKERQEQTGPITVLFTDIAGSIAMTQALGDEGAQQVVRAHNRIVREALSSSAGKEVKHTGDGIMASFARTSDGVDAAIEMQMGTAMHNQQNPNLPLHLKIGLNAGEPIAEDNDLFGTVVQMSARIVDKASADQIYVSEIVRGICAGKQYNFANLGGFEMKGFGESVTLFEVVWADSDGEESATG